MTCGIVACCVADATSTGMVGRLGEMTALQGDTTSNKDETTSRVRIEVERTDGLVESGPAYLLPQ